MVRKKTSTPRAGLPQHSVARGKKRAKSGQSQRGQPPAKRKKISDVSIKDMFGSDDSSSDDGSGGDGSGGDGSGGDSSGGDGSDDSDSGGGGLGNSGSGDNGASDSGGGNDDSSDSLHNVGLTGESPRENSTEGQDDLCYDGVYPFWSEAGPARLGQSVDDMIDLDLAWTMLCVAIEPPPVPEGESEFVISPRMKKFHRSWGHFKLYKAQYMEENNIQLTTSYTNNVERHNTAWLARVQLYRDKVKAHAAATELAAKQGLPPPRKNFHALTAQMLIPAYCAVHKRTYLCTHSRDRSSRGTGQRPFQHVRSTQCPFKVTVEVIDTSGLGTWVVVVTSGHFYHNHPVSEYIFKSYSQNRVFLPSASARGDLGLMIRAQGKPHEMYDYLAEATDIPIVMKDVHNYIATYRKETRGGVDENLRVADFFVRFHESQEGNTFSVGTNADKNTATVSITTSFQRKIVKRFAEVLLIDCTHNVTEENFQLCSLMMMDENGHGQFVQHTLMETNSTWHFEQVLQHFKNTNPNWHEVKVVVLDKDFKEIEVVLAMLRTEAGPVRVLLCAFHVLKYLKGELRQAKYGHRDHEVHDRLYEYAYKMVYSETEDEYKRYLSLFESKATSTHPDSAKRNVWHYFRDNWANCADMWSKFGRNQIPHLSNHTNNRLESTFGSIKSEMPDNQTLSECLTFLYKRSRRDERKYTSRVRLVGKLVGFHFDEELNALLARTTKWVAEQIESEYNTAHKLRDKYEFKDVTAGGRVMVRYETTCYVDLRSWLGSCTFGSTLKLPCRHVIVYRVCNGIAPQIPVFAVPPRWKIDASAMDESLDSQVRTVHHTMQPRPKSTLDERGRFHLVRQVLDQICDVITRGGTVRATREVARLKAYLGSLKANNPNLSADDAVDENCAMGEGHHIQDETSEPDAEPDATNFADGSTRASADGIAPVDDSASVPTGASHEVGEEASYGMPLQIAEDAPGNKSNDDDVEIKVEPEHPLARQITWPEIKIARGKPPGRPRTGKLNLKFKKRLSRLVQDDSDSQQSTPASQDSASSTHASQDSASSTHASQDSASSTQAPEASAPSMSQYAEVSTQGAAEPARSDIRAVAKRLEQLSNLPALLSEINNVCVIPVKWNQLHSSIVYCEKAADSFEAGVLPQTLMVLAKKLLLEHSESVVELTQSSDPGASDDGAEDGVEVVGVGVYTRSAIFAMQDYHLIATDVSAGVDTVNWLRGLNKPQFLRLATRLERARPSDPIPGMEEGGPLIRSLYRVRRNLWFGADIIAAYGFALNREFGSCETLFGPTLSTKSDSPREKRFFNTMTKNMVLCSSQDYVFLPVHLESSHWCCIAIVHAKQTVLVYDSLGKPKAKVTLNANAEDLAAILTIAKGKPYNVEVVNSPLQSDDDNCGLFVCLFMTRQLTKVNASAFKETQLAQQRARVLDKIFGA